MAPGLRAVVHSVRRLAVALAGVCALGVACGLVLVRGFQADGPLPAERAVLLPQAGMARLAAALVEAGVIRSATVFRLGAALTAGDGALHGGELVFPAHASLARVLRVLRLGRRVQHRITFAEGLTAAQMARVVAAEPELEGDIEVPPEGAVLPETYLYERPAQAQALLARAEGAAAQSLAQAWAGREPGLALRSPREALVLASLVERETHLAAERPMVAAVFLNRLRLGMKLQSDPSTVYGASGGLGRLEHGLTKDELGRVDGYNTYEVDALPEGPICSPGRAALLAVLHPAVTDALYFVADGQGGHVFAASLAQHTRNVARYRQLER